MADRFRVSYATLSVENEDLHIAYEEGLKLARNWCGATLPVRVDGDARRAGTTFTITSPVDSSLTLCIVHSATGEDVDDAVAAARGALPGWTARPWQERVELLRRAADLISERANELAALMSLEVGKNRLEALGDAEESADLIRYYCGQVEDNDGFVRPMNTLSDRERTSSVLRPYGVWGVISPFNFPMALAAGPVGAALVAGNSVVLKPSPQGSFTADKLYECLRDAGLPAGVLHVLPGDDEVGAAIVKHTDVDGLTFTGSNAVGMEIHRTFSSAYPKPVICEMGGNNPAIVSAQADLNVAADGISRSAFGFAGQKCSACSRVYVQREVYDEFLEKLAERARGVAVGDPTERDVYMGPLVDGTAVERFARTVADVGGKGRVVVGGAVLEHSPQGHYVQPTVVADLPLGHPVFRDELFVPIVAVAAVDSLDEAITLANRTDLGLTAGFFSNDDAEVERFLDRIEAGVVYINRAAGATTGAWPGVQPFGGWKGSGNSGKAGGGLYYVQLYLREQSRTVVL
ncbi:aldehyde dehydrogenase family protein [Micromonospora globbae]|uniref:aldehyde dehydrogenase family protein n=1 Tax=Micromonospora globbae TaxID=1894969 RepID=UPI003435B6ED